MYIYIHCDNDVIMCHCATKLQWHHVRFRLLEFEIWVLASSESPSCSWQGSRYHGEFSNHFFKARGRSQLPDDNFIHDMKHPQLSANPKKTKQCFLATISSKKIEAANRREKHTEKHSGLHTHSGLSTHAHHTLGWAHMYSTQGWSHMYSTLWELYQVFCHFSMRFKGHMCSQENEAWNGLGMRLGLSTHY